MSSKPEFKANEPRLRDTLREDFRHPDFWHTLRLEFRELKEFYIDDDHKKRLDAMQPIKRAWFLSIWLCKSMLLRLAPFRRLLLVIGILLFFTGDSFVIDSKNFHFQSNNLYVVGGAVLLLVIMLELKDKLLAHDELAAGKKVQQALMPEQSPTVPGWLLWIFSRPANEVGGDLIDFISRGNGRSGVVLADVSGKGLQAALIMAKLQATLKAFAADYESNAQLISKLNTVFHRDGLANSFASLVFVDLEPDNDTIRFVNAGHLPPIIMDTNGVHETDKGDPAIGLMASVQYSEHTLELHSGDVFVGYSDGLTEARNEWGDFFGAERLFKSLGRMTGFSPQEIGLALLNEIDFFAKNASPTDDLSLIVLKRT